MHTFEHFSVSFLFKTIYNYVEKKKKNSLLFSFFKLQAMRNRKKLIQQPEKSLIKLFPANMELSMVGHNIAQSLRRNNTSWLHLNLASIYWRIKGDAFNAIECARRAVAKAPMYDQTFLLNFLF